MHQGHENEEKKIYVSNKIFQFTALIPHMTVVLPNLTIAEPSAEPIDFTFIRIGRNVSNSRPSGRMLWAM